MGAVFFPGVKWPGRGIDHPPHPAPTLKNEYGCEDSNNTLKFITISGYMNI
jgi:hypothetical protein